MLSVVYQISEERLDIGLMVTMLGGMAIGSLLTYLSMSKFFEFTDDEYQVGDIYQTPHGLVRLTYVSTSKMEYVVQHDGKHRQCSTRWFQDNARELF